ncbi:MAG: hypothetical protein AABZ39_05970 [Spirochaetota bacterium]
MTIRIFIACSICIAALSGQSILTNGGFEIWQPFTGTVSARTPTLPDTMLPNGWTAAQEKPGGAVRKSSTAADGTYSILIENREATITSVETMVGALPNTKYRIRLTVKGENISSTDGVYVWHNTGPASDFWNKQNRKSTVVPGSSGTFDWKEFSSTFETASDTAVVRFVLQLRNTSGKAWFDNVTLIREETSMGKVSQKPERTTSAKAVDAQPGTADLRGYGRVTTSFGADRAEFMCENEGKADLLLGKLIADLFWDAGTGHTEKTLSVKGRQIIVHMWPPYGAVMLLRAKTRVLAVGAENENALAAALEKETMIISPDVLFVPSKSYPLYLDFYDLRSFRFYTHSMSSVKKQGLENHWPFVNQFGIGGISFQGVASWGKSPAEGVLQIADSDYEVREAGKNGGMAVPCPGMGEVSLWVHNKEPFAMKQPSPTALLGAWGGAGCAGAHYESDGIAASYNAQNVALAMERYVNDPSVGGWHPYAGSPGAEMGMHERTGDFWDYSPAGLSSFLDYLRSVKKYDLPALGKRWHADASRFKSWNDVMMPDALAFYGSLDEKALRIGGEWYWRKAKDETSIPEDDGKWVPFRMQPSQEQAFLPWGTSFYRTAFDAADWCAANGGKTKYLAISAWNRTKGTYLVWLNGKSIGEYKGTGLPEPFCADTADALIAGKNELVIKIPGNNEFSEGKIFGPVLLTTTKPEKYPFLGKEANARYVDLKEWQAYTVYKTHAPVMENCRAVDTERQFILSPGSSAPVANYANELGVRYGMGMQMTGREAWYHPWWPGYGFVAGYYGTSEPSATARGDSLTRLLSWISIDGDSAHTLFWDIEDYMLEEKTNAWFTRHARDIRLFGKATREKPDIVILRTAQNMLFGVEAPWRWDVGRGELQNAHYDNVYASERELSLNLIDDYRVLMDCGNEIMDDDLLASIKRYVEKGGVFIALHNTGLHTSLEPGSYPLAALSGLTPTSRDKKGTITFAKGIPVLKEWEGKSFSGDGICLDHMGNDSAKNSGLGLSAAAKDAVALARWDDGSIAVGYRKIGKGAVIVLGSSFWRSGKDVSGVWRTGSELEGAFFERLFTDLGVARSASSSTPSVWTRKFITKNGLEEWLIAFNAEKDPISADVSFAISDPAAVVIDMKDRSDARAACSDGWATIKNVSFEGYGLRVFGVKRSLLARGIPVWWKEKTTYWKRVEAKRIAIPKTAPSVLSIDTWKFIADRDDRSASSSGWMAAEVKGDGWSDIKTGPWGSQRDELSDYSGTGLYRTAFKLPAEWKGRRITLNLYSFDLPIVFDEGDFYLNGKFVTNYKTKRWNQTLNYDVTSLLADGNNILAVKVKGGKEMSGLNGAVWLAAEKKAVSEIDASGAWRLFKGDFITSDTVNIPCDVKGQYLTRDIEVPASWNGKEVYLHLTSEFQWLGSVLVNGRPIGYNGYLHPFGTRAEINITPFVTAGKNVITLWPYATIPRPGQEYGKPGSREGISETQMSVRSITLKMCGQ